MIEEGQNNTSRFEVEVRAHISDSDFNSLLEKIISKFGEPFRVTDIRNFLFRSNTGYARIRILKGDIFATLTEKIGSYSDMARTEINREFDFSDIDSILKELHGKKLDECSYLQSLGYGFNGPKPQKIFLSKHQHLGNFLEAEIMTNEKFEIDEAYLQVKQTLKDLGLTELPADDYQNMMNEMYAKTLKPVEEYKKHITSF